MFIFFWLKTTEFDNMILQLNCGLTPRNTQGYGLNPFKIKNSSSGFILNGHIWKRIWTTERLSSLAGSFLLPLSIIKTIQKYE